MSSTQPQPRITQEHAPLVCQWLNCHEADIDTAGDVWVSGPMAGHWLGDEQKLAFLVWLESAQ